MKQALQLSEKSTSLTSRTNTDHLPTLPLPSINVARTRVIFGVDRWTQVQLSHDEKQKLDTSSDKLSVTPSPAGSKPNSRNSSPLVLRKSASNSSLWLYSSGACEVGKPRQRWEGLEGIAAAAGTQKQLSHKQILYLDHTTDNTNIACVVMNGKNIKYIWCTLSVLDTLGPQKFVLIIQVSSGGISTYGIILVPDNLVLIIEVSFILGVCVKRGYSVELKVFIHHYQKHKIISRKLT